ncbi:hypothetical protein Xcel_3427 (plasmid) [Xylanimonas cellulosilytica DSM 15894]|uniref:Lipoprotein n=1 Tax=Xylanimonas cellulosilytica (strain DSM 15894 / JCM 12276 / CECT 5975 / KCTC 9989 / LMG 20990 / NBRC 107835 / XIL07) TaxID=446471 RepID=D1C0W0_XYLCX|nr:hypothetical protein [Xylanimonas cellulosilytica]ACZ32426.1 hypothetical protein Xcel_3427 [Xylanimonas cellulosilytica DSM 15894]
MIRTRTVTITAGAAALVVAAGIALTACQSDPEGSSTPTPTLTSPSPTATPSPTEASKSPEDVAAAAAEKAVHDYYAMLDASLQKPDTFNPDDLKKVAIGTALADAQNRFNIIWGQQGLRQNGSTKLTEVTRTSVDLKPSDNVPIVELRVCWDASEVNVVDKDGKSAVPADRKPLGVQRVGVANYDYPDGPWLVAFTEYKDGETC